MKKEWKPPVPIPVGALLVVKRDRFNEIYPRMRILIYLGWDTKLHGMKLLFPNGTVFTHDHEDILSIFEETK